MKPRTRGPAPLMVLGWCERVTLSDLALDRVRAKLDTGARSSSLHVAGIETFRHRREDWVRFVALTERSKHQVSEAKVSDERVIRDSGGREHLRIVIETTVMIAGWKWTIDLTLADRSAMRFPMLLGRQALSGRALVDPRRSYTTSREPGAG